MGFTFLSTPSARRATSCPCQTPCCPIHFYPRPPRGGRLVVRLHCQPFLGFLSTPSARRATPRSWTSHPRRRISIHALREEGDCCTRCRKLSFLRISIHALREEGDETPSGSMFYLTRFLSTPSARRATRERKRQADGLQISIHALREEGDSSSSPAFATINLFLSTPSARRATAVSYRLRNIDNFYPRPPRGGRQIVDVERRLNILFLSTPSARRATSNCQTVEGSYDKFLSTPSARRATLHISLSAAIQCRISIHALREEGDFGPIPDAHAFRHISIHALREEGDDDSPMFMERLTAFLSTPSARRATEPVQASEQPQQDFYPRPPRGGRRQPECPAGS